MAWSSSQDGNYFGFGLQMFSTEGIRLGTDQFIETLDDPVDTLSIKRDVDDNNNAFIVNIGRTGESFIVSGDDLSVDHLSVDQLNDDIEYPHINLTNGSHLAFWHNGQEPSQISSLINYRESPDPSGDVFFCTGRC